MSWILGEDYFLTDTAANAAAASRIALGLTPDPVAMVGLTPATAVAMYWSGVQYTIDGVPEFATIAARDAWATANLSTLRPGVSKVRGPGVVEYVWKGPLATDWMGIRGPFVGSDANPYPIETTVATLNALASSTVGPSEIWVANPAVPKGKSRLVKNTAETGYVPPSWEMIAGVWGIAGNPVKSLTPGVLALTEIYSGEAIPDYMIPDGLLAYTKSSMVAKNAAGLPNCILAAGLSGSLPTDVLEYKYPNGTKVTPATSQGGIGLTAGVFKHIWRVGSNFKFQTGATNELRYSEGYFSLPFVAGENRIYAMAIPSKDDDEILFYGMMVYSSGNL